MLNEILEAAQKPMTLLFFPLFSRFICMVLNCNDFLLPLRWSFGVFVEREREKKLKHKTNKQNECRMWNLKFKEVTMYDRRLKHTHTHCLCLTAIHARVCVFLAATLHLLYYKTYMVDVCFILLPYEMEMGKKG